VFVDGVFMAMTRGTIVVLRALGLGDLLTGIPALRGLRNAYPDANIVLAAPEPLRELAMHSRAIDEVLPTSGLGALPPLRPPPDMAVNLHGSGPESIADLRALAPGTLLSHRHPDHSDLAGPPWRSDMHEVDRWCGMLEWFGIPCDPNDLGLARPSGHPDRSGTVVIHPGAAAAARRWPANRFAAVASELVAQGNDVVITGSAGELELAHSVARQARLPETAVLAGLLDLMDMVALIHDCKLLVCGDTGVGHIATATGTPSVVLFGPTPPQWWGPRGNGPHVAVWAGDRGDPHAEVPDPGLLLITVARVLEATREVLRECA
jgi:ADP-heptose:LPS heptosyltransferase